MYGSSRIGRFIITFLQDAGYAVDALVAVERNGPAARYARQADLPILVMRDFRQAPFKSLARVIRNSVRFAALLRKDFPRHRTLYCNTFATLPAALIARLMRRRCILHLHETAPGPAAAWLLKTVMRLSGLRAIVVSQAVRDSWGLETAAQVQVVHNGIPDLDTGAAAAGDSRPWDIAFAGRLTAKKGFYVFLDALRQLDTPRHRGAKILILGGCLPGETLPPGTFAGFTHLQLDYLGERPDAAAFFAQSKVACIPSLFADPFPTTALEALRAGCLVAASDTGGLPEALQGTASTLVAPGNAKALAQALAAHLAETDPDGARRNRAQYEARFTLQGFKARFLAGLAPQQARPAPQMKAAILGTVGVPGRYGGFETLAENLVRYSMAQHRKAADLTVYCSARAYPARPARFLTARLRYSRLNANGIQSIAYDAVTALDAVRRGHDVLLLLGVSGAFVLPLIRLVSRARIITNVDGIEWRRAKWRGPARHFLRWSEGMAVRWSHQVIADNQGIADHLRDSYGITAEVIAYGGDHALAAFGTAGSDDPALPARYALALCRIEPENNPEMILTAFAQAGQPLVFAGNWNNSTFGRRLRAQFGGHPALHLLDPVYDPAALCRLRSGAALYVHGHSAGGTNPALVEMMHFNLPVLAYDCSFNRYTTEQQAAYFTSSAALAELISSGFDDTAAAAALCDVARRRYRWDRIGQQYFGLMQAETQKTRGQRRCR
ncbi:glycosyltransferase [Leisingera sp. M658]|uniref:glycosyltransferase family 4 protein n=1 Tax=Leisingera sp. M658 TaxID=2867015 RepID=UPI0021A5CA38|nr:glycosyltransferase [Leisingera sp. M658]UWQ77551.1 glycosyltransferase [Leisingera sp. M658]